MTTKQRARIATTVTFITALLAIWEPLSMIEWVLTTILMTFVSAVAWIVHEFHPSEEKR